MKNNLSKAIIAAAVMLSPVYALAQHAGIPQLHAHALHFFNAAKQQSSRARTTDAIGSRLIARSNLFYSGGTYVPSDSSTYSYSGTRGGVLSLYGWNWLYDSTLDYSYNAPNYVNGSKDILTFDAHNNILTDLYMNWESASNTWINNYEQLNTINASNNVVLVTDITWNTGTNNWDSSDKYTIDYDANNNPVSELVLNWNGTGWDTAFRYHATYDASNNQITGLSQQWNSATSLWENSDSSTMAYDGLNNMVTELDQTWSGAGWDDQSFYHNSNFTAHQAGISVVEMNNGTSLDTSFKMTTTFNSYSQPVIATQQDWDATAHNWVLNDNDGLTRYYYETYTTGVKTLSSAVATASVYPVPAKDEVSIDINWSAPQAFTVTLMDMQGRMYTSYRVSACAQYHDKMQLGNIPAGNYVIKITGAAGELMKKVTIVK